MTLTPSRRRPLRRLALAAVATVMAAGLATPLGATARAATTLRAVIIVGPTGGSTATYKADADAVAAAAVAAGMSVTKIYTPNATWADVSAALPGANLVYFAGHGNGFPDPYLGYLQPQSNDGFGLDPGSCSSGTDCPTYYGEQYIAPLKLAPNALVLLNHLCYAPGGSEAGRPVPTLAVAEQRVDNFAAGFLAAGAGAVFADDSSAMDQLVNLLFSSASTTTVNQLFEQVGFAGVSDVQVASTRTPGAALRLDPHPSFSAVYSHSVSGNLGLTVGQWSGGAAQTVSPPPPAGTTYSPLGPVRLLDTRTGTGLVGPFSAGVPRTFQIAGVGGVPSDAVAVTLNLTVVDPSADGYVSLTPSPTSTPTTSTINFAAHDTGANGVTVPLGPGGTLSADYKSGSGSATTDLVLDVTGAFR